MFNEVYEPYPRPLLVEFVIRLGDTFGYTTMYLVGGLFGSAVGCLIGAGIGWLLWVIFR